MITVLFFGRMADVAGRRRLDMTWPEDGIGLLALRDRVLAGESGVHMSINRQVVRDDQGLRDGDEVAFFPVFSGG